MDLKKIFLSDKKVKIAVFIALAAVLSVLFFDTVKSAPKQSAETDTADIYIRSIEARLVDIISKVDGAGEISVMVTLEDSEEKKSGGIFGGGNPQTEPRVRGAAVICAGSENINVKAKVVELVSKVLGISTARVCVTS